MPEQFEPGTVWRRVRQVVAVADDHAHAVRDRFLSEITREGRLADAGFASEEDEPAMAADGRRTFVTQEGTLPRPPDERYLSPLNCALPLMVKGADGRGRTIHGRLPLQAGYLPHRIKWRRRHVRAVIAVVRHPSLA